MEIVKPSPSETIEHAIDTAVEIEKDMVSKNKTGIIKLYGVPRGGFPAALAVITCLQDGPYEGDIVDTPEEADYIIDDIINSGKKKKEYIDKYNKPFFALSDRADPHWIDSDNCWIIYPWEVSDGK